MSELIKHDSGQLPSVHDRMDDPIASAEKMGEWFYRSGLFGLTTPAAGAVIAMACLCERMNPLEVMKRYHVFNGKLSMRAEAMLAEFNARGGKHVIVQRDADAAEVELTPTGGKPVRFRFSWSEAEGEDYTFAKDGKSLKDNWKTPRRRMQMLWARVISDGIRAVDPGVVVGTYTPEEIEDIGPVETPADNAQATAERRWELNRMAGEPATTAEIEDVPFEPAVTTTETPTEPPAATEAEDVPAPETCTREQLVELLSLAEECGIDKATLREKACAFAEVEEPQHMTAEQADQLIAKLKDAIAKKRSTSE